MDKFGVKKPSLRAIAKTPVIPELKVIHEGSGEGSAAARSSAPWKMFWLGAQLQELNDEEFSAYGVSKQDAGVVLSDVPADSIAAKAGLVANDVIQGINGTTVRNGRDLLNAYCGCGDQTLQVRVVRNQEAVPVTIDDAPYVALETVASADSFQRLSVPAASPQAVTANQKTKQPAAFEFGGWQIIRRLRAGIRQRHLLRRVSDRSRQVATGDRDHHVVGQQKRQPWSAAVYGVWQQRREGPCVRQ